MGKIDIYAPQETKMNCSLKGQKIFLFGGNDVGKTFQSTRMEKPLLLMAESGGNARNCPKFPINDWDDFTTIISQLTSDIKKSEELYQTIIIDTVEELVNIVESKVARRYGVLEVGMVQKAHKDNPNGYSLARNMFKQQINLLTKYGFTVIFISHADEIDYEDPYTGETYKKVIPYNSNKEKGSTKFVRNLSDFVIYLKEQGVNKDTNETIYSKAICKETKNIFARARYAMPTEIPVFTAESLKETIERAIQKTAENEGAGLTEFKNNLYDYTKEDYFEMIKPYVEKLYKLYPDYVIDTISSQLGDGRQIKSATDEEVTELGNIYSEFVAFSCDRGIVIEDE